MWKNIVERGKPDGGITRRMRFACWILKATNTHSEYVIFIGFPLQQWFHERASMLRYTYVAWLSSTLAVRIVRWLTVIVWVFDVFAPLLSCFCFKRCRQRGVNNYWHSEGMWCFHLQGETVPSLRTVCTSPTAVNVDMQEVLNFRLHSCGNRVFKERILLLSKQEMDDCI